MLPLALFLLFKTIATTAFATNQFWLTTVISEFRVRDECAVFWNKTQACPEPLVRVSTEINNPTQFASKAWRMEELINSTEKTSFTSQWHGSLQSVRVSAQIEGSTALNPFGLIAKCDQGFYPKISFNQSSLDVWERLTVRVITIDSQCFSVKILVKLDTECPYCPIPTSTVMVTTSHSSFTLTSQQNLILCALIMALFTILSISVFLFTLRRIMKLRRRDSFKQFPSLDSGISSIAPLSYSDDIGSGEEKNSRFVDFFSVLPPDIDYDDIDEESIDIQKIPRLGSLVYSLFPTESDLSISDPLYV